MSGNPFKIGDRVDGSYEVEDVTTRAFYDTSYINISSELKWRSEEIGLGVLTLDEILEQVKKKYSPILLGSIPFIRVTYETGMWGVIFEVGNYIDAGTQWYVHGVTKGYG